MPLYEYQCKPNGHRFEVRQGINDEPIRLCAECGSEVRRVIQPVGIVFKGAGFYATDSRSTKSAAKPADNVNKTERESGASESKSGEKTDGKSENKSDNKSESKAESKTESKSEAAAG